MFRDTLYIRDALYIVVVVVVTSRRGREIIARSRFAKTPLAGSHDRTFVVDAGLEGFLGINQFTMRGMNMEKLQDLANKLRIQCVQATEASKSGYDERL